MKSVGFKILLNIGFSLVIIIGIAIGIISVFEITKIGSQAKLIYLHPFVVSNAVKDINTNIYSINRVMQNVFSAKTAEELNKSIWLIQNSDSLINKKFEIVNERFLGDKLIIDNFYKTYSTWKESRDGVIEIVKNRDISETAEIAIVKEDELIESLKKEALIITDYAQNRADYFYQEAIETQKTGQIILISVIFLLLSLSVIIARIIGNRLSEINNEIYESEIKIRTISATKDKLYSIIAHDLKSPFNSMLGFSELLIENIRTYPVEKSEEFIQQINLTVRHTHNLLENLLLWIKSSNGKIEFKKENIILNSLINDVMKGLISSAKMKNITLINSLSDNLIVFADKNMLETILRNLIQNAIKFTNSGGKVETNAVSDQGMIKFTISDNGVGMNEETRDRLFSVDTNTSTIGTAKENGSGLGLILCKEFVERHGGKIWVEGETGKGSIFYFTIPNNTVQEQINKT